MSAPVAEAVVVPADQLRAFAAAVARAAGMPADDAAVVADGMVWTELRGIDIGIKRLPTLVARIRGGGTIADPKPVVIKESPTFAVLDGRGAWGQVTAARAMRIAIAKARAGGVGACVVRDTGNALAMGYYPWLAVQEGLIGLAITNAIPLQAPWGGSQKLLGNQAYAIGCPTGRHAPVIFDGATTALSWVGIHEYQSRGEPLPSGVALDVRGEPTTDPAAALAGLLLPAGGHKGYGLALMWEILTGVLSGGEVFAPFVSGMQGHERAGQSTFLLAIDPSMSMPRETFLERVDTLIERIHASPPAPGVERVYVPGERSAEIAAVGERDGIRLPSARVDELRALSHELGVELPEALALLPG
ncbi:MAG TPA: Ldh family oxidoreductase [Candidatus Limnocylindria bacterium]